MGATQSPTFGPTARQTGTSIAQSVLLINSRRQQPLNKIKQPQEPSPATGGASLLPPLEANGPARSRCRSRSGGVWPFCSFCSQNGFAKDNVKITDRRAPKSILAFQSRVSLTLRQGARRPAAPMAVRGLGSWSQTPGRSRDRDFLKKKRGGGGGKLCWEMGIR